MKMKIFVYGTLRKGMYNYDLYLKKRSDFVSYGYIKGKLMTLKDRTYPAFLMEDEMMVLGEIYEVDAEYIKVLDKLENYFGEGDPNNEYDRVLCDIYDERSEIIDQITVYVYNIANLKYSQLLDKVINCCDFVKYNQEI